MMFGKLTLLAVIAPLVAALTLDTPSNVQSNSPVTITFSGSGTDPVFSLELVNEIFHNSFAIANNVQPTAGSITLTIPTVPAGDGYTLNAVNVSDINTVFASSSSFSISAASSTSSASSTASGLSSSSSGSALTTATGSTAVVSTTSGFGTTNSASAASSGASTSATVPSGSSSGTSSASSSTGTNFNSSASPVKFGFTSTNVGSLAVMGLAAVAGMAVVAL